jgi:hypothetical protein
MTEEQVETPWGFAEAARFLGCSPLSLRVKYRKWGVPHYRLGSLVRFRASALAGFVAERCSEAGTYP